MTFDEWQLELNYCSLYSMFKTMVIKAGECDRSNCHSAHTETQARPLRSGRDNDRGLGMADMDGILGDEWST